MATAQPIILKSIFGDSPIEKFNNYQQIQQVLHGCLDGLQTHLYLHNPLYAHKVSIGTDNFEEISRELIFGQKADFEIQIFLPETPKNIIILSKLLTFFNEPTDSKPMALILESDDQINAVHRQAEQYLSESNDLQLAIHLQQMEIQQLNLTNMTTLPSRVSPSSQRATDLAAQTYSARGQSPSFFAQPPLQNTEQEYKFKISDFNYQETVNFTNILANFGLHSQLNNETFTVTVPEDKLADFYRAVLNALEAQLFAPNEVQNILEIVGIDSNAMAFPNNH